VRYLSQVRRHRQRGAAAVELAVLALLLPLLYAVVVAPGRQQSAGINVDGAAFAAARAASMVRARHDAPQAAQRAAADALQVGTVTCRQIKVTVDTSDFQPGGSVTAQVTCTVDLSDVTGANLPGQLLVSSPFSAPIDKHRSVAP